jgi:hypothetical protein
MKYCYKCQQEKDFAFFHNNKAKRDGFADECKQCKKDKKQAELEEDYLGTRLKERARNLKIKFNITLDEYEQKAKRQGNVCAICGGLCKSGRRLAVDHNHTTGAIRDLLCGNCNGGLGKFQDSPELLEKAAEYLRNHNGIKLVTASLAVKGVARPSPF